MLKDSINQLMPMRPVKIVWEDDPEACCTWCGTCTTGTWVIEAEPVPERFCSPRCVAFDTDTCWSPSPEMEKEEANRNG